jgi:hypothetical protein
VKPPGGGAIAGSTERAQVRAASHLHPDLAWVNGILWGVPVETTIGLGVPDSLTLARFVALPNARRPHLLVPDEPHLAQRALQGHTDARRRIRAATTVLAAGARAGVVQLIGDRVRVSLDPDRGSDDQIRPSLTEYLAGVFGRRDLDIAVRMGGRRPNRKPVLQILTQSGEVLAYAKVGWNALTRSLVRNEAQVLEKFGRNATKPSSFSVPTVIHAGQCGDLDVLVLAAVPQTPLFAKAPSRRGLLAASREISSLERGGRAQLATSTWWHATCTRLDALRGSMRRSRFEVLQELVGSIGERSGDVELAFGGWHGDWTCWNIRKRNGTLVVLDWERSGALVPVGLDAARYDFDAAVKLRKRPPLETVQRLLTGGGSLLPAFAPDARLARLLVSLDMLEMVLRFEEARSEGLDILDMVYFGALRSAVLTVDTDAPKVVSRASQHGRKSESDVAG